MISVVILSRYPELYSTRRLLAALQERGVICTILQPERCALSLQGGSFWLYYDGEPMVAAQAVLPRFGSPLTQLGVRLLRHFAAQGSYCLNGGDALQRARDKFLSLQILASASLPVPDTWYLADASAATQALAQLGVPVVSKLLSGSQGVGVNLAESTGGGRALIDTLLQLQHETLLQRFLPGREDCRVIVLGGTVLAAMRRRAGPEEFRSNLHRSGTAKPVEAAEIASGLGELAVAATAALGLDFAGVDLMADGQGGYLVLEVNPVPSLEGIERVSGVDIARQLADFVLSRCASASA
ncbi:RimK family alpha-L-glutamate ligase [Acidithiobacillus sp. IBUN Pt1247-S3]|uniref:ATP-grasp domain-containing protein n=1 Tax=Acidithiobacillus sp. IBUN Pt1247-S3 TaxID=3166642 RepID=UPI0034E3F28C